jgi:hypothetical protein
MPKEGETGNIGDFPYEGSRKKIKTESGTYQEHVVAPNQSSMPGIGRRGGEMKIWNEYAEGKLKAKEEEAENERVYSVIEKKIENSIANRRGFEIKKKREANSREIDVFHKNKSVVKVSLNPERGVSIEGKGKTHEFKRDETVNILEALEKYI